jgi:hypothetical protein
VFVLVSLSEEVITYSKLQWLLSTRSHHDEFRLSWPAVDRHALSSSKVGYCVQSALCL